MIQKLKISSVLLIFLFISNVYGQYNFQADVVEGCDSLIGINFSLITPAISDSITNITWEFEGGDPPYASTTDKDSVIIVNYYNPGSYRVFANITFNITDTTPDSANYINVHQTVPANFSYSDSLELSPYTKVLRHTESLPEDESNYDFDWDFDDGTIDSGRVVVHPFPGPDTFNVSLTVTHNYGCSDTYSDNVVVEEPASPYSITASETEGCDSLKVKFGLTNLDTDTIASILWDFGNGTSSNRIDPDSVTYENTVRAVRTYDITIIINGDSANAKVHNDFITVYRTVTADFRCTDTLTAEDRITKVCWNIDHLYDTSSTYEFLWNFEGRDEVSDRRPLQTFPAEDDTISVSLVITDLTHGCIDSITKEIILLTELKIQNFFTPNDDNIFDEFIIEGGSMPLHIMIFSRTGTLVYEAKGPKTIRWDGTTPTGQKLKTGVYFYILKALEADPAGRYTKKGFVHLFRE